MLEILLCGLCAAIGAGASTYVVLRDYHARVLLPTLGLREYQKSPEPQIPLEALAKIEDRVRWRKPVIDPVEIEQLYEQVRAKC